MKESDNPLVTFYMTVKDGLPFIKDAVHSLQNQTYKNIEIVVVDDGSRDGTIDYLRSLKSSDSRFRVIESGGVGRGKALNIALNHARGLYVANLDADDYAHPQRAEFQVAYLRKTGASFVAARRDIVYDEELPLWAPVEDLDRTSVVDVTRQLFKGNPISHITVMIRKDSLIAVGGYDESRRSQLDYELWVRLAASRVALLMLNQSLGYKRIHGNQSFENKKRLKYLFSSVQLQCSAISQLQGGWHYYCYPLVRFAYGLLPQRVRSAIK